MKSLYRSRLHEWIPALIAIGWAVRQWSIGKGLWLDEAFLGLNLLKHGPIDLLKPLDYSQAAPILYLQLAKICGIAFGYGVQTLRLPSLLSYVVSTVLFMQILRRTVSSPAARIAGISLFCFNLVILRYSDELKQYMTETMVCLAIAHLTLRHIDERNGFPRVLLVFGMLCIALSHTAAMVLTMSGAMMLLVSWRDRDKQMLIYTLVCGLAWISCILLYYFLFVSNHPAQQFMVKYWTQAGGFGPKEWWRTDSVGFLIGKLESMVDAKGIFNFPSRMANVTLWAIPLFFWLFGSDKRNRHLLMLPIPLLLHSTLSLFHLYPFDVRLTLYLYPLNILAVAIGFDRILRLFRMDGALSGWALLLLCIWQAALLQRRSLPFPDQELKVVSESLFQRIRTGERIFLNHNATFAYDFYRKTGAISIPSNEVIRGQGPTKNVQSYSQQIAAFDSNTWLLMTHIRKRELVDILQELKSAGFVVTDSITVPGYKNEKVFGSHLIKTYAYRISRP